MQKAAVRDTISLRLPAGTKQRIEHLAPALKMINEFDESTKKFPLIPMGTRDPYRPAAMPATR